MPATSANPLEQLALEDLRARSSMKWRTHPADVLPLWVAEMDVVPCPPVVDAVTAAMRTGDTGYATGLAYAEALAGFAERRWGWPHFPVGRSAVMPDVMLGIVEALRLVTDPGDCVVVNPPVYPPFYAFTESLGRTVVDAPLSHGGRLDMTVLDEAFTRARAGGRPTAYLLCSPHNPIGTVHTAEELEQVAELSARHGVRVIADEIHAPLVLPGARFVPFLSVAGDSTAFAVTSASKGWNLAGLKAAVLSAGKGAARDLARLPEEVSHGPSHIGVLGHVAALEHGGPWLDALIQGLDANRSLLGSLLAEKVPSVRWRPPEATYLAWLDLSSTAIANDHHYDQDHAHDPEHEHDHSANRGDIRSSAGPAGILLSRGRLALSSGSAFGSGGTSHVRLNFATSRAVLIEAVRRMSRVINGS